MTQVKAQAYGCSSSGSHQIQVWSLPTLFHKPLGLCFPALPCVDGLKPPKTLPDNSCRMDRLVFPQPTMNEALKQLQLPRVLGMLGCKWHKPTEAEVLSQVCTAQHGCPGTVGRCGFPMQCGHSNMGLETLSLQVWVSQTQTMLCTLTL